MSRRIIMAVTNDLATDQRADRSCRALNEAGYEVTLVGRRLRESPDLEERGYRTVRMRLLFRRSALFYAEYNLRLLTRLLFMSADAYYSNDTDTLAACCMAARLRRWRTSSGDKMRLLFDAHELFPDVPELVGRPRVQHVWKAIERMCLPHVDAAFTVSEGVAEEYRHRYGVEMTVVRNVPESESSPDQSNEGMLPLPDIDAADNQPAQSSTSKFQLILYQGAVNEGRGVRELVDVMSRLKGCRLMVAGVGDLLDTLSDYAASKRWADRISFLGRVEPRQLRRLTKEADLGICLLEDRGLSYRNALPNRIGDFVQAGVPILATGFDEIRRVVEEYGTGTLTEPCPHKKGGKEYEDYLDRLAKSITDTLNYWNGLEPAEKACRFDRAKKELCWEVEKNKLIEKVDAILK